MIKIRTSPRTLRNVFMFATVAISATLSSRLHADDFGPVKISQDPYTDPAAQHRTEVGPSMVAHGDTIVSAFQVGRFQGTGSDNIGWATSRDAGKSWQHGFLSGTTTLVGGPWPAVSLAVAAFDEKHKTYLIAMMPFDSGGNGRGITISRSEDAMHWSAPITAATSAGTNGHWLACDNSRESPFYGNCYDAYLDYTSPTANYNVLVVSKDGGKTWSAPVLSPDTLAGLPTSLAVQPNGNFVVLGRNAGPNGDQQYAIPSANGGATLEPSVYITTQQFDYPYLRSDPILSSAVDGDGVIYVVFPDCRFKPGCPFVLFPTNDLVMTTSTDGTHWSTIQRIPIDPVTSSVDHVIPGLGAFSGDREFGGDEGYGGSHESRTKLALTFYSIDNGTLCVPANCDLNAAYISSDDGGKSWHKAHKIAGPMMQTWLASTYAGQMVSDYLTVAFVHGQPFGTFALARAPNAQTGELDEAIYATPLPDNEDQH
jgi:hypothetical protein